MIGCKRRKQGTATGMRPWGLGCKGVGHWPCRSPGETVLMRIKPAAQRRNINSPARKCWEGSLADGTPSESSRGDIEQVQLLRSKILQKYHSPSCSLGNSLRIALRRHQQVLAFRNLPQL